MKVGDVLEWEWRVQKEIDVVLDVSLREQDRLIFKMLTLDANTSVITMTFHPWEELKSYFVKVVR